MAKFFKRYNEKRRGGRRGKKVPKVPRVKAADDIPVLTDERPCRGFYPDQVSVKSRTPSSAGKTGSKRGEDKVGPAGARVEEETVQSRPLGLSNNFKIPKISKWKQKEREETQRRKDEAENNRQNKEVQRFQVLAGRSRKKSYEK